MCGEKPKIDGANHRVLSVHLKNAPALENWCLGRVLGRVVRVNTFIKWVSFSTLNNFRCPNLPQGDQILEHRVEDQVVVSEKKPNPNPEGADFSISHI